jgi:transposase
MAKTSRTVIGGVDTHADTHTAAALDSAGRLLGHRQFATTAGGCQALLAWLRRHGQLKAVGVEGTGSYGAGLARLLTASGVHVVEVDRPNRKARRSTGKSDPVDAEAAARAVLAGVATGTPKSRSGVVEAIRVLRVVRTGAVKARTAGLNTLVNLARTAPEPLGAHVHGHSARQLVRLANTWRPAGTLHDPVTATKSAMRRLARRIIELDQEIRAADGELRTLLQLVAPKLLDCRGVGPEVAGQLLITAGDNPTRLADDRAFALLTGVAPLLASSGRTDRHRLNRGGDRAGNNALHTVVLSRMRTDPATRAYVDRRTKQGLNKREIIRCLKRYIVRELFPLIVDALTPEPDDDQTDEPAPHAA